MDAAGLAPLTTRTAFTAWQWNASVLVPIAVLALLYGWGVLRVRRAHPVRPWPVLRAAAFASGLAVVVIATESSVGSYDDELFSVHMVQHLLLIMVAPSLFVVGRPLMLLLHASRNPLHRLTLSVVRSRAVRAVTCPPVAAVVYAVVIVGTHLTSFMNDVLLHDSLHDTEHLLYLVAGYLYFLPLLGSEPIRWRMSFPSRFLLLALTMPVDTFVGVVLLQTDHELFPAYQATGRTWGPSLVDDLHAGGAVMWIGGDGIMFVLALALFVAFLGDKRSHTTMGDWLESARRSALGEQAGLAGVAVPGTPERARRGATIDDDEHLAAYNAYLARLSHQGEPDEPRPTAAPR